MAVNRSRRQQRIKTIPVTLDEGATLNISYQPSTLTPDWHQRLDQVDETTFDPFFDLLLEVLVDWDFVEEDDAGREIKVPVTKANLAVTELHDLRLIVRGMLQDAKPGETSGSSF
jgi:hypothetical protein